MRHVVLVELYWTRDKDPRVPLGHASILASLKRVASVEVHSVVRPINDTRTTAESVADAILDATIGLEAHDVDVAIGVYVWAEAAVQALLPILRRRGFRGRLILGGPQISYAGVDLEAHYPDADVFVRGYGEQAMMALALGPERRPIQGVHYAGEPDACRQAKVDLESLASPWLDGVIPLESQRFVRWESQRGCPFRCAFCQHREAGARLTRRSLARTRIDREIELFCRSGVTDIAVLDPIFNLGGNDLAILERFVSEGYEGRLSLQCRAEAVSDDFVRLASLLDTRLEFGLQTIHANEAANIDRRNDLAKVDRALGAVVERGIACEVSVIFGLPGQTFDSFLETIGWCLARRVPTIKAFPLLLLRGTKLERERHRWNLVDSGGPMATVVASNTFGPFEWNAMAAVSEALSLTEGRHPANVAELVDLAHALAPRLERWRPEGLVAVA